MPFDDLKPDTQHATQLLFKVASVEERQALRDFKKQLLQNNTPITQAQEKQEVEKLYQAAKPYFNKLPQDAALVLMPSGSGRNTIPEQLALRIRQEKPEVKIYNQDDSFVVSGSQLTSKTKGNFAQRTADQRSFHIIEGAELERLKKEKQVFILDDVVASGETATILKRQLEQKGVRINGIAAPLGINRSFASERDLNRLHDKLKEQAPAEYAATLKKDLYDAFAGFPRRKLTIVEGELNRNSQIATLKVEKNAEGEEVKRTNIYKPLAYQYISKLAESLRQLGIDATSIEQRQSQRLEKNFPGLSKENIERYEKLLKQVQGRGRKPGGKGNEIE